MVYNVVKAQSNKIIRQWGKQY